MGHGKWLLERYIGRTILAYLALVLFFLTGALVTQQAGRLLEVVSASAAPGEAVFNTLAALLPTLLTLALPMAVLLATIIGLSQMGSDSELIALQASGAGLWVLARPVLLLGLMMAGLAFYLNLVLAPQSARILREIGLRAAQYKLESPVEPHTFNTDIPDYVLYIRGGNRQTGAWQNVFIYNQTSAGEERLITAKQGRIDFAADTQSSELFLTDAVMLSQERNKETGIAGSWTADRAGQTRLTFRTGRQDVLQRLQQRPFELDELTLAELRQRAAHTSGLERRTALVLAQKKQALSVSPLLMALLGLSLGIRVRRGGRGAGLVWGLLALVLYYLVSLVGEQLARKGTLHPVPGVWLAQGLAAVLSIFWLATRERRFAWRGWWGRWRNTVTRSVTKKVALPLRTSRSNVSGLNLKQSMRKDGKQGFYNFPAFLDRTVLTSLNAVGLFTLAVLVLLLLTFTLFELWRFVNPDGEGYKLVAWYLWYLMPLFIVQTLPGAGLIAALATYALMSRHSEATAWWASGQSTYRLMLPAFLFALALSGGAWWLQEKVMPQANLRQDDLRAQIKGSPKVTANARQWLAPAHTNTLYNYEYEENTEALKDLRIFEFGSDGEHLERIIRAAQARWVAPQVLRLEKVEFWQIEAGSVRQSQADVSDLPVAAASEVFRPTIKKASQLDAKTLHAYIQAARGRGEEVAGLTTALQFKYAAPFNALILIITGVPLALGFDRRRVLAALGTAVLVSIASWLVGGVFQQLGTRGLLPPLVAAWTPTAWFAGLFIYLLSRTKT